MSNPDPAQLREELAPLLVDLAGTVPDLEAMEHQLATAERAHEILRDGLALDGGS